MLASPLQGGPQCDLLKPSLPYLLLVGIIQALLDTGFDNGPKCLAAVQLRTVWGQEQGSEVLFEVGNYLSAMMRSSIIQ